MSVERPSPPPANTVSRRTFLRTLGIAGGGVVVAPAFVRTPASAQETPSPLRPDPTAKRGGTLRYAVHNAPAHFDVHQSGTVANIRSEEHTSELQSHSDLVCRLLLEK